MRTNWSYGKRHGLHIAAKKKIKNWFFLSWTRFCSLCWHHDWVFIPLELDLSLWIQSTNSFKPTCWRIFNSHWTQHCSVVQVCFPYCSMHWKITNLFIFFQTSKSHSEPGWLQEKICLAFQPNPGSASSPMGICHLWHSFRKSSKKLPMDSSLAESICTWSCCQVNACSCF